MNRNDKNKIDLFFETLSNNSDESFKFIKGYKVNIKEENTKFFIKKLCKSWEHIWRNFLTQEKNFLDNLQKDILNYADIKDIIKIDDKNNTLMNELINNILNNKSHFANKYHDLDLLQILEYEINLNRDKNKKIEFKEIKNDPQNGCFYYKNVERITKIYVINENLTKLPKILSKFTELEYLNLSINKIEEIDGLKHLKKLKYLLIQENNIINIDPLKSLLNLIDLRIFNNKIKNISPIKNLSKLENLYAHNNNIDTLKPTSNLDNIKNIWLYNNLISDITSLSNLIKLEKVHIGNNPIETIPNLKNLTQIETFSCNSCKLKDISNLKSLENIKYISLEKNNIENIPDLSILVNLIELNLKENQIKDITPILKIKNLRRCFLEHNKIEKLPEKVFNKFNISEYILSIEENPLSNCPPKIVKAGNEAIMEYFKDFFKKSNKDNYKNLQENTKKDDEYEDEFNKLKNYLYKKNYEKLGEYIFTHEKRALLFDFLKITLNDSYLNKIQQIDATNKNFIPFLEASFYIIGKNLLAGKNYDKKYLLFLFKFQLKNLYEIYDNHILFPSNLGELPIEEWLQICWVYSYYLTDYHLIKDINIEKLNINHYYMFPNLGKLDFREIPKWFNSRSIVFSEKVSEIFAKSVIELIKNNIIKTYSNRKPPHFIILGVFIALFPDNEEFFDTRKDWLDEFLKNIYILNSIIIFLNYLDDETKIKSSDILVSKLMFYTKKLSISTFNEQEYWKYLLNNISDKLVKEITENLLIIENSYYDLDKKIIKLFPKDKEKIVKQSITNYLINNIKEIQFFDLSLLYKENLKEILNSVDLEKDWLTIRSIAEANNELIIEKLNELIENKNFAKTKHLFYEYGVYNLEKVLDIIDNEKYNFIKIDWMLRYLRKRLSTSGNLRTKVNKLINYFENQKDIKQILKQEKNNQGLVFIYENYPKYLNRSEVIETYKSFSIKVHSNNIIAENENCIFGFTDDYLDINTYNSNKYPSYDRYLEIRKYRINELKNRLFYHIDNLEGFTFLKIENIYFQNLENELNKFNYNFEDNNFINKATEVYMKVVKLEKYNVVEPNRNSNYGNKDIFLMSDYIFESIKLKLGDKVNLVPYIINKNTTKKNNVINTSLLNGSLLN